MLDSGDREGGAVVVRGMQHADHGGPGVICLVCAFRDALDLSRLQAQTLAALYLAPPDAWVTPAAIARQAGRSHRPENANTYVSLMRKKLGDDVTERLRLAGWRLTPAMRLRCEGAINGPSHVPDTAHGRIDDGQRFANR